MAKLVWTATPIPALRTFYFKIYLFLVRGQTRVANVDGITFVLDLSEIIDAAIFLGSYESDVKRAIDRYFREGQTALDIGANVGAHALLLAQRAGPRGRVYAFEPTDYAYRKLITNMSHNNFTNLQAFQLALSNKEMDAQEIKYRSSWRSDGQQIDATTRVDFRRLDIWCHAHSIDRVDFIKIDVDGEEFPILAGALSVLQVSRPTVVVEIGVWHFRGPTPNPLSVLHQLGYRFMDAKTLRDFSTPNDIYAKLAQHRAPDSISINIIAEP